MDTQLLEILGKVAGIGGISLGVLLLIFRSVIQRNLFPKLSQEDSYKVIRLIIVLTFVIATFGILAWAYVATFPSDRFKRVKHFNDRNKEGCMNSGSATACDAYVKQIAATCGAFDAVCRGRMVCWQDKARAILIVQMACEHDRELTSCQSQQNAVADLLAKDCDEN